MSQQTVIGLVKTHNVFPPPNGYLPSPACSSPPRTCNVSKNGLLDWAFAANDSCPPGTLGVRCSSLDLTGVCPNITQSGVPISPTGNWWSNQDSGNPGFGNPIPPAQGRYISCEYPLSLFNTAARIDLWLRIFNNGSSTFGNTNEDQINKASFDVIMQNYCGQLTYNCPLVANITPSPLTNCPTGPTGCSILHSNAPGLCTQWYGGLGPTGMNNLQQTFCMSNSCATDCLCVNRVNNVYYQAFQGGFTGPSTDSCWFNPCRTPNTQYIPNNLLNPSICPAGVCLSPVFNSVPTGLSPTGVTEFIFCPVSGTGGNVNNPESFWDVNGIYIILAITGFIILILFIIILAFAGE